MKTRKTTHILVLALVTVVVFAASLNNSFVWDDKFLVVNNPYVKNLSYLPEIFSTQLYTGSHMHSNFYRPLELLSFAVDYSIWHLNPFGYHLTSLLLHAGNVILVYFILIAVGLSGNMAFLGAMLFSVSPPISGITYYISARSDLLMALFLFLSFLLFVKYRSSRKIALYFCSILFFIFSLLSKEMALILIIFLALEIFRSGTKNKKDILPYILIFTVYSIMRVTLLNFNKSEGTLVDSTFAASIPLWRRLLTDIIIVPKYIGLLLFPYGLHMEWFIAPAKSLFQPDIILSLAVCILLVFIIAKLSRRDNLIFFGSAWFLLGLLPVLNIYPISVFFGEGWLYVPSVGFYIALAAILKSAVFPKSGRRPGHILAWSMVIFYCLFTFSYGKVWKDGVSLFANVLKYEQKSPFAYSTYNNLGVSYYDKGELEKAIKYYKRSTELNPEYENPCNNLGVVYIELGRQIKAIKCFKKAIVIRRDYLDAYSNLSHAYKSLGLNDRAIEIAEAAIKIDPYFYDAHISLGYIYADKGETDKAISFFTKAREIRKAEFEPSYCLGTLYIKKNKFDRALNEYEKALKLGLGDYKFYNELAFLYLKNKKFKESEHALLQSLLLNPKQSEPHNNLGNLYSVFGYFKLAADEYNKALEIDPGNRDVQDNMRRLEAERRGSREGLDQ